MSLRGLVAGMGLGLSVGVARAQMLALPVEAPDAAKAGTVVKLPAWDVTSVKEHKSDDGMMRWSQTPDGLSFVNLPLLMLLQQAYELYHSTDEQVTGLPGWAKSMRFDVEAKVSAEDVEGWKTLNAAQRSAMLRALLEERFGLKAHKVTTEMPVYALVVAKSGAKLGTPAPEKLDANGKPVGGRWSTKAGGIEVADNTLEPLISILTQETGRTVVNRTGLTGKYDYTLNWTPNEAADAGADNGKAPGAPLFTAIQEQLGLRLESTRGPVVGLVVDKVDMPSAN